MIGFFEFLSHFKSISKLHFTTPFSKDKTKEFFTVNPLQFAEVFMNFLCVCVFFFVRIISKIKITKSDDAISTHDGDDVNFNKVENLRDFNCFFRVEEDG